MDITKSVTKTTNEVVGYRCDLCNTEHEGRWPLGKGTLSQTLDDFHDSTYTKQVDLCDPCTTKVFRFIEDQGGKVNDGF
jgi:hypothetical protein